MSDPKYSVLFMRDDTDVKRYRVSPFWLKALAWCLGGLLLMALLGLAIGIYGWRSTATLKAERRDLETRLNESVVELERIKNLQKMAEAEAKEAPAQAGKAKGNADAGPRAHPVSLKELLGRAKSSQLSVDNVQFRSAGAEVAASLEITNLTNNTLTGAADIAFIRNDGQAVPAKVSKPDLAFQIQRFKHVKTAFPLPEGADRQDIFALRLEIKGADGTTLYRDTYPLGDAGN